ncbi:hypothetical protein C0J50_9123 [Silurus asotus]|uniref:Uncharacterized protein n=1 Tax=Silurus asotus TaxID=30991 RepID=A0AAD5ACI2_SILAS|nr:hypothetical protein C0J50_9123 [Silurus asotus]
MVEILKLSPQQRDEYFRVRHEQSVANQLILNNLLKRLFLRPLSSAGRAAHPQPSCLTGNVSQLFCPAEHAPKPVCAAEHAPKLLQCPAEFATSLQSPAEVAILADDIAPPPGFSDNVVQTSAQDGAPPQTSAEGVTPPQTPAEAVAPPQTSAEGVASPHHIGQKVLGTATWRLAPRFVQPFLTAKAFYLVSVHLKPRCVRRWHFTCLMP